MTMTLDEALKEIERQRGSIQMLEAALTTSCAEVERLTQENKKAYWRGFEQAELNRDLPYDLVLARVELQQLRQEKKNEI